MKILILGGYGTFGARLARLLADQPGVTLLIAGRSRDKAAAFCASLKAGVVAEPLALDRNGDVHGELARLRPDLVVDASGPFQAYGDDPYRVVRAALALGIDYIDLADGEEFVGGFSQFDQAARARGVFLLSGASSFPLLSAAAVRRLARSLAKVDSITGGIAPSPNPDAIGPAVVRAIASYAGKPVVLLRDGRRVSAHALTETRRHTIAPPGHLPLESRIFSLVQVPDLQVLPALWPEARSVWLGAGPVPAVLHRLLIGLAWLVRLGMLPSLSPIAGALFRAYRLMAWGEHRGGMFLSVAGTNAAGERLERSWHLLAEGDDGPYIPSIGAAAIVMGCRAGKRPAPGARSATAELELEDYEPLFANRAIVTGIREVSVDCSRLPLYRLLLGDAWHSLPAPLQAMHDVAGRQTAAGLATVERGTGLLARLIGAVIGFPRAGLEVPVTVEFERRGERENWRRDFAGRSFASSQSIGRGKNEHLMVERFGTFAFGLALVVDGDRLRLVSRRWSVFG
ncbi:MAG: saccharopine dehydrogenase NADP-binding domain-containing protein, partial [Dongiaceae bacterium]